MSDIIDQAYDEMELDEVICRLPSEFAIKAVKRRINSIDKLKDFFKARDAGGASKCQEIKNHINEVVSKNNVDDIFSSLTNEYHPTLFGWLNSINKERLLKDGRDKLTVEFIFNLTSDDDLDGMKYVLNRVLSYNNPEMELVEAHICNIESYYFYQYF